MKPVLQGRALALLGFLFLSVPSAQGEPQTSPSFAFPDKPGGGIKKIKKPLRFPGRELYGHIDGGAELFLEFGFDELEVQKYRKGKADLSVEAYRMESPEAALGIYLMKKGKETPVPGISARNTGDRYQAMILKGLYLILVNNYGGDAALEPMMRELANRVLERIPDVRPADLLSVLPQENRIKGSELLIRGPYALQSIYTFGNGDVFLLKGKVFGVAGDYQDPGGGTWTEIIVPYPSGNDAQAAFSNLKAGLDPDLKVTEEKGAAFAFLDRAGKSGEVLLEDARLRVTLR